MIILIQHICKSLSLKIFDWNDVTTLLWRSHLLERNICKFFFMKYNASIWCQHRYLNIPLMSQLNSISLWHAFKLTHASIRTFMGCNVAWFTVLEKGFKAQNYLVPTHSPWCSLVLSSVNLTQAFISQKRILWWLRNHKRFLDTTVTNFWFWCLITRLYSLMRIFIGNPFLAF